jgi:hypothetical protein
MSEKPKSFGEQLAGNYQFYLFALSLFAVAMGAARAFGKSVWEDIERTSREEHHLPIATLKSAVASGFEYSSLLSGGVAAIVLVSVLFLYVVAMLLFSYRLSLFEKFRVDPDTVLRSFAILMLYPVLMMAFFIYESMQNHADKLPSVYEAVIIGIALVFGAIGLLPLALIRSARMKVALQALALTLMALLASFVIGEGEGIKAADPTTSSYVAVESAAGGSVLEGWLYETTDTDYRLVTKDGANLIVPAASIRTIMALPNPAAKASPTASRSR